jgi:hypothetical protein
MMRIKFFALLGLVIISLWNCSDQSDNKKVKNEAKFFTQQQDGIISLRLANADYYKDVTDPSNNTAEWNVLISKTGEYKVWLSSATKDTVNLNYSNTVKVNLPDSQLAVIPACDKIIHNSQEVYSPYFRADSFMGSFYVSEPGKYNIQVISEKVISEESADPTSSSSDDSRMMAVILSPMTN